MRARNSDRNLLFGILALQIDFITRESLVKAMNDWVLDKEKPLGEILVANEALSTTNRELLEQMVSAHVEQHDNDPEKSLAALSSVGSVRDELVNVDDADVKEAMTYVSMATPAANEDATITHTGLVPSSEVGEGSSLNTRFRIIRPHAEGGLGKVSVAMDRELNREVALKEIKDGFAHDDSARTRFTLEAEITGGLEHPGIVPVYGLGHRDDGQPFYAMRFIKGDSLKEACAKYHDGTDRRSASENAIEFRQLLGRFIDVCNAIEYAHSRGVLHRDLKPGNIMLGKYGETLVVDWGLAKAIARGEVYRELDEQTLQPSSRDTMPATQMGSAIGTPHFMSPEQAAGRLDELGPASDVYSLGATLYYVLVNRSPFTERNLDLALAKVQIGEFDKPRQVDSSVPRPLEAICLKAMSTDPSNRYATAKELANEIDRWLADEPIIASKDPVSIRVKRWIRRHPKTVASLTASTLVGLTATVMLLFVIGKGNQKLFNANAQLRQVNDRLDESNSRFEVANEGLEEANQELQEKNRTIARTLEETEKQLRRTTAMRRLADAQAAEDEGNYQLATLLTRESVLETHRAGDAVLPDAYRALGERLDGWQGKSGRLTPSVSERLSDSFFDTFELREQGTRLIASSDLRWLLIVSGGERTSKTLTEHELSSASKLILVDLDSDLARPKQMRLGSLDLSVPSEVNWLSAEVLYGVSDLDRIRQLDSFAFSPDNQWLVAIDAAGDVPQLVGWKLSENHLGTPSHTWDLPEGNEFGSLAFSGNGDKLAVGMQRGVIRIFDWADSGQYTDLETSRPISRLCFDASGEWLVASLAPEILDTPPIDLFDDDSMMSLQSDQKLLDDFLAAGQDSRFPLASVYLELVGDESNQDSESIPTETKWGFPILLCDVTNESVEPLATADEQITRFEFLPDAPWLVATSQENGIVWRLDVSGIQPERFAAKASEHGRFWVFKDGLMATGPPLGMARNSADYTFWGIDEEQILEIQSVRLSNLHDMVGTFSEGVFLLHDCPSILFWDVLYGFGLEGEAYVEGKSATYNASEEPLQCSDRGVQWLFSVDGSLLAINELGEFRRWNFEIPELKNSWLQDLAKNEGQKMSAGIDADDRIILQTPGGTKIIEAIEKNDEPPLDIDVEALLEDQDSLVGQLRIAMVELLYMAVALDDAGQSVRPAIRISPTSNKLYARYSNGSLVSFDLGENDPIPLTLLSALESSDRAGGLFSQVAEYQDTTDSIASIGWKDDKWGIGVINAANDQFRFLEQSDSSPNEASNPRLAPESDREEVGSSIALSSDASVLAVAHGSRLNVYRWENDAYALLHTLSVPSDDPVKSISLSPTGDFLTATLDVWITFGSLKPSIIGWNLSIEPAESFVITEEIQPSTRVEFSSDGRWVAVGGSLKKLDESELNANAYLFVWKPNELFRQRPGARLLMEVDTTSEFSQPFERLVFSYDGHLLATREGGRALLWQLNGNESDRAMLSVRASGPAMFINQNQELWFGPQSDPFPIDTKSMLAKSLAAVGRDFTDQECTLYGITPSPRPDPNWDFDAPTRGTLEILGSTLELKHAIAYRGTTVGEVPCTCILLTTDALDETERQKLQEGEANGDNFTLKDAVSVTISVFANGDVGAIEVEQNIGNSFKSHALHGPQNGYFKVQKDRVVGELQMQSAERFYDGQFKINVWCNAAAISSLLEDEHEEAPPTPMQTPNREMIPKIEYEPAASPAQPPAPRVDQ